MKKCFGTSLLPRRKNDESVLVTLGFDVLALLPFSFGALLTPTYVKRSICQARH